MSSRPGPPSPLAAALLAGARVWPTPTPAHPTTPAASAELTRPETVRQDRPHARTGPRAGPGPRQRAGPLDSLSAALASPLSRPFRPSERKVICCNSRCLVAGDPFNRRVMARHPGQPLTPALRLCAAGPSKLLCFPVLLSDRVTGPGPLVSCLGGARRAGLWPVVAAVRVSIAFLAFTPSLSVAPRRLPASKLISRLTLAPLPFAPLFPAHACHSAGSLFLKVRKRRNKRPASRGKTERQI